MPKLLIQVQRLLCHDTRIYVRLFLLIIFYVCSAAQVQAVVRYVKPGSAGSAPYTSWATASNDLQAVINASVAGDDIWVAAGTYIPNRRADALTIITVGDRDNAFVLKNGVRIFGGFNGTETATNQRNFATNISILSGDLGTAGSYTDNCYHVVVSAGTVSGTALNGFHIRYGNANGTGTITVNAISLGRGSGAGMRINSSSPTISNCVFSANITTNNGGGMVCDNASPPLTNCLFAGNTAVDAGALYNVNASAPQIVNCSFSGNNATTTGGAIRNSADSDPEISNCIIWGNLAAGFSNSIFNSDIASVPLVNYSIIEGGYTGTKNQNSDPLFTNPVAATLAPSISGDYRLQLCSPGINGGLNSYVPGSINNDLDYNPRIHYGKVDCGVYEKQLALAVPNGSGIVFVDSTRNGNGSSWANAVKELADALIAAKYNSGITQIWVANGTYYPKYDADDDASLVCSNSNRNNAFVTVPNVPIYGGFSGNETLLSQRDPFTNTVKLSGNIGAPGSSADNAYHVLINAGNVNSTLDGINIVEGNANGILFVTPNISVNGYTVSPRRGGGLFNIASVLTIFQCTVESNYAGLTGGGIYDSLSGYISNLGMRVRNNRCAGDGGGWYSSNSQFIFWSGELSGNESGGDGGGIYLTPSSYQMNIFGSSILSNESQGQGGGICSFSTSSSLINLCRISGNESVSYGGALFTNGSPDFVIKSSLISGNVSDQGAAIWHAYTSFTHTNITVTGNRATTRGGAFGLGVSNGNIRNTIVYGNSASTAGTEAVYLSASTLNQNASIIQGGFDAATDADPLFIAPEPAASAPTSIGNYRIQKCSPALNGGNNTHLSGSDISDLDFTQRVQQIRVDMGAYELNIIFAIPGAGGIIYVDSSKTGNGSSWANATPSLSDALQAAKFNSAITQIWVAKGTYYPVYDARDGRGLACTNTNRNNSFVLVNNVKIYGGFNGTETIVSQRDFVTNKTTLNGDIGTIGLQDDNCYHVVVSAGNVGTAELDGFSIINGRGLQTGVSGSAINGTGVILQHGAGLNCAVSSPRITNCRFENNIVSNVGEGGGGAMYISLNSQPVISQCSFSMNVAALSGGAIFTGSQFDVSISNCNFSNNQAPANGGGAIYVANNARATIDQSMFTENEGLFGGAILNSAGVITKVYRSSFSLCDADFGGAIHNNVNSSLEVDSSTFAQNSGIYGGAIHAINSANVTLSSCSFSENNAFVNGGVIFAVPGVDGTLTDCIFSANTADNNGNVLWFDNSSDFLFLRCRFENNGIANPGGCTIFSGGSTSRFENCIIKGNIADYDHLLMSVASNTHLINTEITGNELNSNHSSIAIIGGIFTASNCTIAANKKNFNATGSVLWVQSTTNVFIDNSIIWGNETNIAGASPFSLTAGSITATNSIIQGGYTGTNILNADPRFILPEPAANAPTTAGNYRIKACSPAINSGDNALIPSGITVDLDSMSRIYIVNVDRGAYERRLPVPDINGIVYVDSSNVNNEGDGSSWANAAPELADALKAAITDNSIEEIWVANGTYIPLYRADDNGTSFACSLTVRDNTFRLLPNVKIYGGFAGGETDTTGRDFIANETILSGDIGTAGNHSDNAYHVAMAVGNIGSAVLDGFTITRGNANVNFNYNIDGNLVYRSKGGGMQIIAASPLVNQCLFNNNYALLDGGAMYINTSSAIVKSTVFSNNEADDKGGAVAADLSPAVFSDNQFNENKVLNAMSLQGGGAVYGNGSAMTFRKCDFTSNEVNGSGQGGGMFLLGNAKTTISACNISGNVAGGEGGGLYTNNTTTEIINSAIYGNVSGADGGAIYNYFFTNCSIKNSTIAANRAAGQGGGIVFAATGNVSNSIIYNNLAPAYSNIWDFTIPTVSHSIIQGGYAGTNNFDLTPLFINPQSAASAPTTTGDYRLQACSPALNAGNNSLVPSGVNNDLDSLTRIRYDLVDIGAYEKQDIDLANSTWKGVNTNWNDKINWCGGYVPYDTTNVIIPLTTNQPVVGAGFSNAVKNISLASGTSLTVNNTSDFTIHGTYSNSGSAIHNLGEWVMAGNAAAQLFPGSLGSITAMHNLRLKNPSGIGLNKSFSITGALIPEAGNIELINDTVTLKSGAAATARIDSVRAGASFSYTGTGKFEIERYIPARKAWRLLTAPVNAYQSINADWQEGQTNLTLVNSNTSPGYGTHISGPQTGSGFDFSNTNNPSMMVYNQPSNTVTPIANTNVLTLNHQQGYMLFVHGSRGYDLALNHLGTPDPTVLRSRGTIKTGDQPIPVAASGFTLIGNPYASSVDFDQLLRTNTGNAFTLWDPNRIGSYGYGGYVTFTKVGLSYVAAPPPVSAGIGQFIQSGAAFFVEGSGTAGTITFHEKSKVDNTVSTVFRSADSSIASARINLIRIANSSGLQTPVDGTLAVFSEMAHQGADAIDAGKKLNDNQNIGLRQGNRVLAIEGRAPIGMQDTLFLNTSQLQQRSYVLEFIPGYIQRHGLQAWLIDKYLNQHVQLSLADTGLYQFAVQSDAASAASDRFMIVFQQDMSGPVPVQFTSVNGTCDQKAVSVQWSVAGQINIRDYAVEFSTDGRVFAEAGIVPTQAQQAGNYLFVHTNSNGGNGYYRVRSNGSNGETLYSEVVFVPACHFKTQITVHPNPVINAIMQVHLENVPEGIYRLQLFNAEGKTVWKGSVTHSGGTRMYKVSVDQILASGQYVLRITQHDGQQQSIPLLFR